MELGKIVHNLPDQERGQCVIQGDILVFWFKSHSVLQFEDATMKTKLERDSYKRHHESGTKIICAHCGKEFLAGDLGLLSMAINNHKPACSYECNKALGQVSE